MTVKKLIDLLSKFENGREITFTGFCNTSTNYLTMVSFKDCLVIDDLTTGKIEIHNSYIKRED